MDVTAPTGAYLHLHRLLITDDPNLTPVVDDDFEDDGALGFGSDYWHSSGSANLGNSQRNLIFSFENTVNDETREQSASENISAYINYLEPDL